MNGSGLLAYDLVHAPGAARPDVASRTAFFVHGILGAGRNWRSFTRRLAELHPSWRFVLPDLRNHGDSPSLPGPHTVAASAADLARLGAELGRPELVVGHSFGGKVALAYARMNEDLRRVVVLDAPPGAAAKEPGEHEALGVIAAVRSAPAPASSREEIRSFLRARGLSEPIIAWLLTSTAHEDGAWRWKYDLDGVEAMIGDYFALDFWPWLEALPPERSALFVRAGRSDRWSPDELARFERNPHVGLAVLPNAGHWLHVDDPDGLIRLLGPVLEEP